jgi:hypothetical protein
MPYTNATGTAAVAVSYPPQSGEPHAYLVNTSGQVAYIGGQYVTSVTGLPLYPNCRADLASMPGTVYAVAGFQQVSPSGTTTAATTYPGGTALVTSAALTANTTIVIEPGTQRQEFASVGGTAGGTVFTSAAMAFGHASGISVSAVTPYITTIQAVRGAS